MTRMVDIDYCPDGELHVWGESRVYVAHSGPMEGDWVIADCLRCKTGMLHPRDGGGSGIENFLAALEAWGCDPRPVDGD